MTRGQVAELAFSCVLILVCAVGAMVPRIVVLPSPYGTLDVARAAILEDRQLSIAVVCAPAAWRLGQAVDRETGCRQL